MLRATRSATATAAFAASTVGLLGAAPASVAASAPTLLTHAQATAKLRAAGIPWDSPGKCADAGDPTCTSFDGVRPDTIQGVITLQRASGCTITVTAGTEVGHSTSTVYSHSNGWKLDLRLTSCLADYVNRSFRYQGPRGDGYPVWKAASGNLYCKESNHWDVLFHTNGG